MNPSWTVGPGSDRGDLSNAIATHSYELPVVREIPIKPPDASPEPGWGEPPTQENIR